MPKQPKYVYGKENPNYTGPDKANDIDSDLDPSQVTGFHTGNDVDVDPVDDDEIRQDAHDEIIDRLQDPNWQSESKRLRNEWRDTEDEREAVNEEFKEIVDESTKIVTDTKETCTAVSNARADAWLTPEGNIRILENSNGVVDAESDVSLAKGLLGLARNDGDMSPLTDILGDSSNFEGDNPIHDLGRHVIEDEIELTPEEARKLSAAILFETTNEAADMKQDACLDAYLARSAYDDEEDRLANELREIVGERGHASYKHEEDELGDAKVLGVADENSPEWLQLKTTGIGGSEMLAALGYKSYVKKDGTFSKLNAKDQAQWVSDTANNKAKTFTEEDVNDETTGPAARGHAWEPALLAHYQNDHDDVEVAVGKQTWKGDYDFQTVNVDGIIRDKDTHQPVGLLECKNSDKPEKWENGVPPEYKAQVLDYLDATGLGYCDLVARVDGEMTTYRVNKDDPIDASGKKFSDLAPDVEDRWKEVKSAAERIRESEGEDDPTQIRRRVDIPNDWRGVNNSAASMEGLGIGNYQTLKDELNARKKAGETVDSAVRDIISQRFDRSKMGNIVGVDGETAGIVNATDDFQDPRAFSPLYSSWIETGIVNMDSQGNLSGKESILHGVDDRILKKNGTGAEDVHHITPEMVDGKPTMRDRKVRGEVFKKLVDGDAIVAHNVNFEQKHLFHNMPLLKPTSKWVDTAWMSRHFMPNKVDGKMRSGKLQDFAEDNGVEYKDAHRAAEDSEMMMKSMNNFLNRENWHVRGQDS